MTDPKPTLAQAIETLTHGVHEDTKAIREDLAKDASLRTEKVNLLIRSNKVQIALLALMAVLLVVTGALTAINFQLNRQTKALAIQTKDTNARLIDCTVPTGKCYQEGRETTSKAVEFLVTKADEIAAKRTEEQKVYFLKVAKCDKQTQTVADLEKCVNAP